MWTSDDQQQFFEQVLFQTLGQEIEVLDTRFVSGGSINTAARVFTPEGTFFVKFNHAEREDMFEKEMRSLAVLADTEAIDVARVLGYGQAGDKAYLVQEFIENGGQHPSFWRQLGEALALLHSHTQRQFGLGFDNYIGALPQNNQPTADGVVFFVERRLRPQVGLAFYNGWIDKTFFDKFERFYELLPGLLPKERPALIHGDLWSGNFVTNPHGFATLIDPATHYGFREAELAFTYLFGGFDDEFYEAYHDVFPLEPDFDSRISIYNLYPLLVHVNLFGKSYLPPVERVLKRHLG